MAEQQKKKTNKAVIIGVAALVAVIAILTVVFFVFREKPVKGAKSITIEVVDNNQKSTVYEVDTDAEYLRQAMDEAEGLSFSGAESEYGLFIDTVNGVTAVYETDGAYWSFYVKDGEGNYVYCNYGVDTQPVEDGDAFQIKYEVYTAE